MKHVSPVRKSPEVFFQMGAFSFPAFPADNKWCDLFYSLIYPKLGVQLPCASKYTFKFPLVALSLTLFQNNILLWVVPIPHKMFDQGIHVAVLRVLCLF